MKIYIDFEKQAIVKITTEDLFEGDIDSNKFIVLFSNYGTNTNWYPTLTQLAPNGREAGAFNADALEDDATHEYTEDDVNYLKYEWTITNEYALQNGRSNFFIYVNTIKNGGLAKKVYAKFTCVLNESDNQYFVADPEFNPKVKQYIDTYSQLRFDGVGTEAQIEALTENKGIWLCIDDTSDYNGYFFYWNDATEQYVPGNVFQATEVADGAITWAKLAAALKRYLIVNGENNTDGRSTGINLDYTNYFEEDRENLVGSKIDIREDFIQIENSDISTTSQEIGRIYISPEVVRLLASDTTNQSKVEIKPTEIDLSSPTKIGDLLEDYWEFNYDTLWLKGSSHFIKSNSGKASIGFDHNQLDIEAEDRLYLRADDTIEFSGRTRTALIIDENGAKFPYTPAVANPTTYDFVFNGGYLLGNKTPYGGSTTTLMSLNPEQGLVVQNDLLDIDPTQYMVKNVDPFKVGIKTGTDTGTFVKFSNVDSRIDFKTANTSSDLIYMNNVKLVNKNYVDNFSIDLVINSSNFQMYAVLKNASGTTISTSSVIDLPLESVVVSGSYDAVNKKVVLTLQNGSTIEFSVADLIDGLQSEITAQNPLDADLVNDTTSTHKFVNASEKQQITTNATNITALQSDKADLTNSYQVITADKVKVNEIQSNGNGIEVKNDTFTFETVSGSTTYDWIFNGNSLYLQKITGGTTTNHFVVNDNILLVENDNLSITPQQYLSKSGSLIVGLYDNSVLTTYSSSGIDFKVNNNTLSISSSTNKLTYNSNEIIDTNNATTELFLTDAEMTTLISEVFD